MRPFIGPIRYGSLKLMKKMRAPRDRRPIIATSDHVLSEIVLPSAFRVFKDGKFRQLANFAKLPVVEHDRIFNELQTAAVGLAIFYIRTIKPIVRPEDYHFWQDVETHLLKQFQKILMGYGVNSSNAKLVKQLVEIRSVEYEELARGVFNENYRQSPEFKSSSSEVKWIVAAVQATAICTADHIRRGKIQPEDHLIVHLKAWLMILQRKIGKFMIKL